MEEYQLTQLRKLLDHAYANVPYYTRVFDEGGLKPKDIQDFKDLRLLPYLTKELVRENLNDLRARNFQENRFEYVTTGGSTGTPLGFYYEKGISRAIEWAYIKTLWDRVGYRFTDKCAVMKGSVVKGAEQGHYYEKSFFGRWLILSSYHMTKKNLETYLRALRRFKPTYIQAYPSTITILARFVNEQGGKPLPNLKSIFCSSENIFPSQRALIQGTFQCRLFSWYGHSERTILAGECEGGPHYHIFPEYGITEFATYSESILKPSDSQGVLVGTGLTNYAMPLIRYVTDDFGALDGTPCDCGMEYPRLSAVEGRWKQEFVVGANGQIVPFTALNTHSDIYDNVAQFQFYQDKAGELILNIVKGDRYVQKDTNRLRKELLDKLGSQTLLEINFVDSIPLTQRGKFRFVIQNIQTPDNNETESLIENLTSNNRGQN